MNKVFLDIKNNHNKLSQSAKNINNNDNIQQSQ